MKNFDTAYVTFRPEITVLARKPFLDMEPDDIAAEMTIALWRATETYDPCKTDTSFGAYWWSVWLNRRSDLAQAYHATKRPRPDPVEPHDEELERRPSATAATGRWHWVEPPRSADRTGKTLWMLLSMGNTARESMALAEITKRAYYAQIQAWRTPEVYDLLMP